MLVCLFRKNEKVHNFPIPPISAVLDSTGGDLLVPTQDSVVVLGFETAALLPLLSAALLGWIGAILIGQRWHGELPRSITDALYREVGEEQGVQSPPGCCTGCLGTGSSSPVEAGTVETGRVYGMRFFKFCLKM